jgi:Cu2+-exporting ATPase
VAGALAMNVMGVAFALYGGYLSGIEDAYRDFFRWISLALTALVLLWPGRVFFRGAWAALRTRTPNMDLPIALGIAAGFAGGAWSTIRGAGETYFESVAVLVFLLLCGRFLQQRQQRRAWDAVELLHALTPARARRLRADGAVEEVPVDALAPGDRLELLAGDTVPADGLLRGARSRFDMAVLTGESVPVTVEDGGRVHAGTVHLGGRVTVEVDAVGADTRVGRLMQLVERYAARPARIVQLADRISGWFTVVVLLLAIVTVAVWWPVEPAAALQHAVALLIVACPCALGLATPLALVAAVGRAAAAGILVKGGDALERLARPGTLLLDKTGTLTLGRTELVLWRESEAATPGLGARVAALEAHATHPFAAALRARFSPPEERGQAGEAPGVRPLSLQVEEVELLPGRGIRGRVEGHALEVLAPAAAAEAGAPLAAEDLDAVLALGGSPVAVVEDGRCVAAAGFGDPLHEDATAALATLRARGWRPRILSGDHPAAVAAVGAALGLAPEDCRGGMTPEDKVAAIEHAARDGAVTMVGDGWNDAAALAAADTGVAVHGGAEASLAAADVYLARPGLGGIVALVDGAERTARIVRRNLLVSLGYNATGTVLAMAGFLNPLVAAVLMPVSSLTVVAVAWRSRSFDPR